MSPTLKRILVGVLAVMPLVVSGQESSDASYVRPALTIDERVVAPDPKPWAFPVYEAPQVDLSTGSGSIGVGLYSWTVGDYGMSVSLGYALGGHTLDEKSGIVGLGWDLSCAGMVYRDIAGQPDEETTFRSLSNAEIDALESENLSTDKKLGGGARYLADVEEKRVEAMYDRYHYKFPGHSGSFIIKGNTIIMLPADNVTITRIGEAGADKVRDFRIDLPDGTACEFTEREHTGYQHNSIDIKHGFKGPGYASAVTRWHLKRIITPEGADTITYHYATLPMWSVSRGHRSEGNGIAYSNYKYSYTSSSDGISATSVVRTIDGKLLSKISSRTATVEFMHQPRYGSEEEPQYISGFKVVSPEGTVVRECAFTAGKLRDGRRVLTKIEVKSAGVLLDGHEFGYEAHPGKQPGDFFGYANGKTMSGSQAVIDPATGEFNQNRRPGGMSAAHGAMSYHTTQAGVRTDFVYEPNTMVRPNTGDTLQIGIRLKSIRMRDAFTGRTRTREFSYSEPMCNIDFLKVGITAFVSLSGLHSATIPAGGVFPVTGHNVMASTLNASRLAGAPLASAKIYYGKVTEDVSGTGLTDAVRTEYEFDTSRCELQRTGGNGSAYTSNEYYLKKDIRMPDGSRPATEKLLSAGFANYYFAECNYAKPRLRKKLETVCENGTYRPLREKEYFYSLRDSAAYYTGLYHELLTKDYRNTLGVHSHTYKSLQDFVYVQTAMLSGRWRLDSVSEKRHYRTGNTERVAQSGTSYGYTSRILKTTGDDVAWAKPRVQSVQRSNSSSIPVIPVGGRSRVFGDTISDSSVHEYLTAIVTCGGGHRAEHHTAYAGQRAGQTGKPSSLPVAEMWIVDGRDSLLKRYEYGRYHGLTRPTRVTLGIKGAPVMAEQRFTAYTPLGQPLNRFSPGKADERYSYTGDYIAAISTGPEGNQLTTQFTHQPLVGCTSITSPYGKKDEFGYEGSRLAWHKSGGEMLEEYDYAWHEGAVSPNMVTVTSHAAGGAAVARECHDGFGALIGRVKEDYGTGGPVLAATVRDALGRVTRQWAEMPVGSVGDALRSESVLGQAAEEALGDARAFTEYEYPGSAEEQAEKVTLAGTPFSGHASKMTRVCSDPSVAELKVRRLSWDGGTLRCSGYYGAGELEGTREEDADGVTVITLHDALGREVLRRAVGEGGVMADTYTVSDAWGNPLLVLQPEGSKYLSDGEEWNTAHLMIDGFAFVYRYDRKLRRVSKRVPGCVAELTAYDTDGRVAYSRDGSVGSMGRKRFYLYDEYSRLAASGLCDDFTSEADWSAEYEVQTLSRSAGEGGSAGDYDWSSVSLPVAAQVTDVKYYDRYMPEHRTSVGIASPLGLVTAERTMEMEYGMPGAAVWVTHHYNAMGQEIQSVETRPEGDKVLWSGSYTVGGLPLQSNSMVSGAGRYHTLNVGTGYDAFGRVREQKCVTNLGGGVLLERNEYDGAGRLAGTVTQGGLRTTYSYDARGALMERKDSLLEMMYSYATGDAPSYAGRISGRKTRVRNGMGYDVVNSAYRYDAMGRLVESTVKQGTSELPVKPVFPPLEPAKAGALLLPADHSEAFTYDLNANVLTIERKGRDDAGQCRVVDDVEMTYAGNRLSVLRDAAADALLEGSMDMPEGVYSGYDIRYDAAGRLTRDVSRGIANINYSVTGMPWVVGTMSGDCAEYGYTSSGVKLWERIYNGNRTTRREYVGPCEYVDGKLMRVNVSQGYIDSLGVLHAYIRDIQGNVAGVYAAKAGKKSLEQLNWYYAYGGLTADSRGQDRNRYKHTGKELVTDLGLNSYDFTARWQYPMAGAFSSPDAKASDYKWLSPYAFCGGDPINFVDPTGMDTWGINHNGEIEYHIEQTDNDQIVIIDKFSDNGEPISATYKYKTLALKQQATVSANGTETNLLRFDVSDTSDGFKAFEFVASNTDVEWSFMNTSRGYFMTTSNNTSSEGAGAHVATALASNDIGVSLYIHSHPNNTMEPSGMAPGDTSGDVKFAQSIDNLLRIPTNYYIFIPKNQSLIQYGGNSVPNDFTPENRVLITSKDFIKKNYTK